MLRGFPSLALCGLVSLALLACSRTPVGLPEHDNPCLLLDPDEPSAVRVSTQVSLNRSDVLFLIDFSASMADEIDRVKEQLIDVLIPAIRERVSDPRMGVSGFSDFGEELVRTSDAYVLLQEMTDDVSAVQEAVDSIVIQQSGDLEESQLEALYQVATGEGLGVYVDAHDCPPGTRGGVCFREGSFAIVLLFTDAPMRMVQGLAPDGSLVMEAPFDPNGRDVPYIPYLRTYEETLEALETEQIRVIGLWSGDQGIEDMRRVANDTGALDEDGAPLVIDIGRRGQRLGPAVVESLERITASTRLDVGVELYDAALDDRVDPRDLVLEIEALRTDPPGSARADPGGEGFVEVPAGVEVTFELTFDPSRLADEDRDQRYPLGVEVTGSDGTLLHEEIIDVYVPAAPTDVCAPASTLP